MKEPVNAKKIRLAAEAAGFETFTAESTVTKPAVLWASNGDGHNEGDVRTPEETLDAWVLRARHMAIPTELAFEVIYAGGFHSARVIDPTGREVELWANYEYNKSEKKSYGYTDEYAEKKLQERNYMYNDGETYTQTRWALATAGEMYAWLDGIMDALKVDHKRLTPKKREKKPERTLLDDFNGQDWIG